MANKLPVSRLQRDLSDSTVLRNLGTALGYCTLAWDSALRGLGKLAPCVPALQAELDAHWEVSKKYISLCREEYEEEMKAIDHQPNPHESLIVYNFLYSGELLRSLQSLSRL